MFGIGGSGISIDIALDRKEALFLPGESIRARITLATKRAAKVRVALAGLVCLERYEVTERKSDVNDLKYRYVDTWQSHDRWVDQKVLFTAGQLPGNLSQT